MSTAPASPTRRRHALLAPLLSALVTAGVFCTSMAFNHRDPFGPRSRLTNDLGAQFVPFHAELRDLLTGRAPGDLLFSWTSGAGVPFLPDLATYLTSPLAPLVVLFPRDRVDLAVYVITVLKMAGAAAAMTCLLRALRPGGSPWFAAALGVAYGTCGWAVDDGAYVPMWLDGFAGLPLLALVAHWSRSGRRLVVGGLVVGLVWWANYYTAYMASIGAALMLLTWVAAQARTIRDAVLPLARFVAQGLLGVGLTAVTLVPTVRAVSDAQPSPPGSFSPYPWDQIAARLLPASEGVGLTPSLGVGTVALLLAACLPFVRVVPGRTRAAWTAGLILVVVSLQVPFTQSAWHGFDVPNGSPFREAFVVCAWLVVMAWLAVADGPPRWPALAGGAVVVGLLAAVGARAVGSRHALVDPSAVAVLAVVVVVTGVLLLVSRHRPRLRPVVAVTVLAVVACEATWTATVVDLRRESVLPAYAAWGTFVDGYLGAADAVRSTSATARLATTDDTSGNNAALTGIPGIDYYSSTMPAVTSDMFVGLGARWAGYGRSVRLDDDDVALASILGVGHMFSGSRGLREVPAMPLVRPLPGNGSGAVASTAGAFANRALLLGPGVYTLPATTGPALLQRGVPATFSATCPADSTAQVFLPGVRGPLRSGTVRHALTGRDGVVDVGSGHVDVTVTPARAVTMPPHVVGCLDRGALARVGAAAAAAAPAIEVGGHAVSARWPSPQTGRVVVATATSTAWECRADGRAAAVSSAAGLLAVDARGASTLTCSYETPGLRVGAAASGAAALVLGVLAVIGWRRRRAPARSARAG